MPKLNLLAFLAAGIAAIVALPAAAKSAVSAARPEPTFRDVQARHVVFGEAITAQAGRQATTN